MIINFSQPRTNSQVPKKHMFFLTELIYFTLATKTPTIYIYLTLFKFDIWHTTTKTQIYNDYYLNWASYKVFISRIQKKYTWWKIKLIIPKKTKKTGWGFVTYIFNISTFLYTFFTYTHFSFSNNITAFCTKFIWTACFNMSLSSI